MYSPLIQKLVDLFSKFPTVGQRTASRFVFYLIKNNKEEVDQLLNLIKELKEKIKPCSFCFSPFEAKEGENFCPICANPLRDKGLVCVVEKEADLEAIEKTGKFKGLYFIIGENLGGRNKEKKEKEIEERFSRLEEELKKPESSIKELILALNATTEGHTTILWLQRKLKSFKEIKTTLLARGLPIGGELEYSDEETLSSALEGRR